MVAVVGTGISFLLGGAVGQRIAVATGFTVVGLLSDGTVEDLMIGTMLSSTAVSVIAALPSGADLATPRVINTVSLPLAIVLAAPSVQKFLVSTGGL